MDIFEGAWREYHPVPAKVLLNTPNGDIAAMLLLSPSFESLEALHQGKASEPGKSREFLVARFLRVFGKISGLDDKQDAETAANAICKNVRNNVVHTGFPLSEVGFHRTNPSAFLLSFRRLPDGRMNSEYPDVSILFNAERVHDAVTCNPDQYVAALRQPQTATLQDNFDRMMRSSLGDWTGWQHGRDDRGAVFQSHMSRLPGTQMVATGCTRDAISTEFRAVGKSENGFP